MSATATVTETSPICICEGDIVTILGDNRFTGRQGIVIDTESDKRRQDGPIAVFFDTEVPDWQFYPPGQREQWSNGLPNKDNYRDCCRVICFKADELRRDGEFPLETIVRRKFGDNYHCISSLAFPLHPGTHSRQFESCKSGQLATKLTLVNVWGTILTVYACEACHKEWHGVRTDGFTLEDPLPGA